MPIDPINLYDYEARAQQILPPHIWDSIAGGAMDEVEIVVQQRVIPAWASEGNYEDDAAFRARFQQWIGELWAEKDALLESKTPHA